MDRAEFAALIDHTALGPETCWSDVERVLGEATEYGMNACVPPAYVAEAVEHVPDVAVVTVVGFPHGQHAAAVKEFETEQAWRDGADEVDVVVNVGRLLDGDEGKVRDELARVVAAVPIPVKVIVEAPLLTEEPIRVVSELARDAGASMVKTSTGVSAGGATVEDVRLMAEYLPVKASGGVDTFEGAARLLEAGADRIGSSSGVALVEGFRPDP